MKQFLSLGTKETSFDQLLSSKSLTGTDDVKKGKKERQKVMQSVDSDDDSHEETKARESNEKAGETTESPFDQLLSSKASSGTEDVNLHKAKKKRLKLMQSIDSDEDISEETKSEQSNGKAEKTKKTIKSRNTFDSDSDDDGDRRNASMSSQSQGRALIDSDSENDGSGSVASQNVVRNRPLVIDSDSDSDFESLRGTNVTKVQSVKNSPLKESSILNSFRKKAVVSSDEEMESVDDVSLKPNKSTKHFLSSSEDSGGESNSPKKARIQEMSKLRM